MALCWGPQCSWTAFIKLDKSSQQNEILAFSWHCVRTLGLPEDWGQKIEINMLGLRPWSTNTSGLGIHSFYSCRGGRLVSCLSDLLMKTIKFAGLGWSLYETLFSIFTSPAASWRHLAGRREGGFILLEVMLNLLGSCYCYTLTPGSPVQPGNNTSRPEQECISYRISVSHCHNLYWLPREQECSDLTPRTIQQYLASA